MLQNRIAVCVSVSTALVFSLAPVPAAACIIDLCRDVTHLPAEQAPANLPGGFADFNLGEENMDEDDFELHRVDGDKEEQISVSVYGEENRGVEWAYDEPLREDSTYRFRGMDRCSNDSDKWQWEHYFETTEPAPLPTRLGTLEVDQVFKDNIYVTKQTNACRGVSMLIAAHQVVVALVPTEELLPWWDLLDFALYVDGERWGARASHNFPWLAPETEDPWQQQGKKLLFARCYYLDERSDTGLKEGTYTVEMRAQLPGTDRVLTSESLEVELSCDDVLSPRFDRERITSVMGPIFALAFFGSILLAVATMAWGFWRRWKLSRVIQDDES